LPLLGAFAFLSFGALLWAFGLFSWLLAFSFGRLFAFTLGLLMWEAFGREKNY
jgi:hypothetical protein